MKVRLFLFSLILLIASQLCDAEKPEEGVIVRIKGNKQQTIGIGTTAEFQCETNASSEATFQWTKSSPTLLLLYDGENRIAADDRLNFDSSKSNRASTFRIDNVKPDDAGDYECAVFLSEGDVKVGNALIQVIVKDPEHDSSSSSFPAGFSIYSQILVCIFIFCSL